MLLEGGGLIDVAARERPEALRRAVLALVRLPQHGQPPGAQAAPARALGRRHRRRRVERLDRAAVRDAGRDDRPGDLVGDDLARRHSSTCRSWRRRPAPRRPATTPASSCFTRGSDRVRVPYYFRVTLPRIGLAPRDTIKLDQTGDTSKGTSYVDQYRYPTEPFGPPPFYSGKPFNEDGAERVYTVRVSEHVANCGRRGGRDRPRRAGRAVVPRLAERGRRPGLRGHAAERQRPHLRVPVRQRVGRGRLPARGPLLRRRSTRAPIRTPTSRCAASTCCTRGRTTSRRRASRSCRRCVDPRPAADRRDRHATAAPASIPLSLVLAYKQTLLLAALYDPGSGLVLWALDGAPKIGGRQDADARDRLRLPGVEEPRPGRRTCSRTRSSAASGCEP